MLYQGMGPQSLAISPLCIPAMSCLSPFQIREAAKASMGFLGLSSSNAMVRPCNFRSCWAVELKIPPCETLTRIEQGAQNSLNERCNTNTNRYSHFFKRRMYVWGRHKGKNCLREPVYLKNVPCCSSLNCLSSLE